MKLPLGAEVKLAEPAVHLTTDDVGRVLALVAKRWIGYHPAADPAVVDAVAHLNHLAGDVDSLDPWERQRHALPSNDRLRVG